MSFKVCTVAQTLQRKAMDGPDSRQRDSEQHTPITFHLSLCSPNPHKAQASRRAVSSNLSGGCAVSVALNYPPRWTLGYKGTGNTSHSSV